jgi:hypothetical protein
MAVARVKKITTSNRKGKVLKPSELKTYYNGQFQMLANDIKDYIISEAQAKSKHKFRKDGANSMIGATKIEFDINGIKIDLPDHAQHLNNGRTPMRGKKPPISAIISWIKRYRIVGRDKNTGKYKKASGNQINQLAFAIQRSIWKNGLKPRYFIEPSIEYAQEKLAEFVDDILIPDIMSVIDFKLKKKK